MKSLSNHFEVKFIHIAIVGFWFLFWFLNSIDKVINKPMFLWASKDRVTQLTDYFSSIGVENANVALATLIFIAVVEIAASLFLAFSLVSLFAGKEKSARLWFFWGTLTGLGIFTFFAIGDQIFGDRMELLEHATFWTALLVSWGAYTHFLKEE